MSIKDMFIKPDIEVTPKASPVAAKPTRATIVNDGSGATVKAPTRRPLVKEKYIKGDPETRETLIQSMQEKKLPGFDYFKFLDAVTEASSISQDEGQQFKIALLGAKQVGATKAKLVASANHYIEVLDEDAEQFAADLAKQTKETVGSNTKRINELEKMIAEHNASISALNAEIEQYQAESEQLTNESSAGQTKLDDAKASFDATYQELTTEIKSNIEKINQYL